MDLLKKTSVFRPAAQTRGGRHDLSHQRFEWDWWDVRFEPMLTAYRDSRPLRTVLV